MFDCNLKMNMQITNACQNVYYHLHNIRRIRKFLSQEATCTIIHAFITSQIDYCNSWMNGIPDNLIKKLQRVQNTAARLVFNLRKYDMIAYLLYSLRFTGFQSNTRSNSKHCCSSSKDFMTRHLPTSKKWSPHQKAKKYSHKIQWRMCPEGSKIQAWYFWQACIRSVLASGMELIMYALCSLAESAPLIVFFLVSPIPFVLILKCLMVQ